MTNTTPPDASKKIAAGILGILVGTFGVHKFVLGYTTEGAIMLVVSLVGIVLSCFVLPIIGTTVMWAIGLAEGIIYLMKTDEEFVQTYLVNRRGWF